VGSEYDDFCIINQLWAAGGGLRIIAPTGPDNITSGKWQMMPIVGARTMLPELSAGSYFQGALRYDLSFAGDPTKKNISNLQLWPMLNISLPDPCSWSGTELERLRA
jgi:hypothetical protein